MPRLMRAPATAALALSVVLLAVCGDGGPTDPDGGGDGDGSGSSGPASVASVQVTPSSGDLDALDATLELSAVARDGEGNVLSGRTFEWSSTAEAVATVDSDGVVTAAGNGSATVRATTDGVSGSATVTVRQVPRDATVEPSQATLDGVGATQAFTVASTDANGHVVEDASFTWTSTEPEVATVDEAGLVTAEGPGQTKVIATADDGGAADTAHVTVDDGGSGGEASIALSTSTASFSATEGGDDPAAETIDVTNAGTGSLTGLEVAVAYPEGEAFGWLSAGLGNSSAPTTLSLDASTGGLAAGSYTATVSVISDVADNSPAEITVTFDVATPSSYTLTVDVTDSDMGSVVRTPDQPTYAAGSVVSVAASPATGHEFVGWSGDIAGTDNPLSVTIDADLSVTADFRINPPELTGPPSAPSPFALTWSMEWPCYDSFMGSCLGSTHDGYVLEESTTSSTSGFTQVFSASSTRTSPYTTELTRDPGTYYYRVRAVGEGWASPYSEVLTVEVTSGSATTPAAPSDLSGSASGTSISLTWTDNSTNEDGFELLASTSATFTEADTFRVGPDVTSAGLTGPPNSTFYFRVRAYNGSGASGWSNTVNVTTDSDLAFYATANNAVMVSSTDASAQNTVFAGALAVGCDFAIGPYSSDYACRSGALQFAGLEDQIAGATITSATLRIYPEVLPGDFETTYVVNPIAEGWDPNTLTWANQPPVITSLEDEQPPPTSTAVPLEFDVTAMVQAWADGSLANHGLLIWDSALTGGFPDLSVIRTTYFERLEAYSSLDRRPQLVITIQ